MAPSAHSRNPCILLTGLDSYLSVNLARSLIDKGLQVYAVAKKASYDLVSERNFTLLDLDLAQPLPAYLPTFDTIFQFQKKDFVTQDHLSFRDLPAGLKNIINYAKDAKIAIVSGVRTANQVLEKLAHIENVRIFLTGDIYGPDFDYSNSLDDSNILTALITQALTKDKIILENEGREAVYPTYISDAILALSKFAFGHDSKKIRFIISQVPTTALEVAYEIQSQIGSQSERGVQLFFSQREAHFKNFPQPQIRITDLGYEPKIKLEEGLKKVFEHLKHQRQFSQRGQSQPASQPLSTSANEKVGPKIEVRKPISSRSFAKLRMPIKSKKLLILITLVLLFFLGKTIFDVSVGISQLNAAGQALSRSDFATASQKSQESKIHLSSASNTTKLIFLPKITSTLEGSVLLSSSLNYFSQGAQSLVKNLQVIAQPDSSDSADYAEALASLQKAYFLASNAKVRQNSQNTFLTRRFGNLTESADMLTTNSSQLIQFVSLLPDITGTNKAKTYLVLIQDNWQLRPGGGFIKAYGLLRFENGHLKNIDFDDIYSLSDSEKNKLSYKIDTSLKEKIEPPDQYSARLGIKQLFLRDSNTSSDFAKDSAQARDLFKAQTGESVDGVIALDLTFLESLLQATGPIQIESTQISAENLNDIYLTSPANADLLPKLADKFASQLTKVVASGANLPHIELLNKMSASIAQKHFLASVDGTIISPFIKSKQLDNPLPPASFDPANNRTETRDYLALTEANLGANEVNKFIERKIEYQLDVGSANNLASKLKITYTNNSLSPNWPQGTYVNFLRVYVPKNTFIVDYQEDSISKLDNVKVEPEGNLTIFSSFVEVVPKSTRTLTFTYSIGKTLELEKAPSYHLYVQKQPGTLNDRFTFILNLPSSIQIASVNGNSQDKGKQNFKTEKDLSTDRQFDVILIKH